jgi:hypothetical protein
MKANNARLFTYLCAGTFLIFVVDMVIVSHIQRRQETGKNSRRASHLTTSQNSIIDTYLKSESGKLAIGGIVNKGHKVRVDNSNISIKHVNSETVPVTDHVIAAARKVSAKVSPVLVSLVNYAYVTMTCNWLCNTADMGVHPHVLLLVTDQRTQTLLQHNWPNVASVIVPDTGNLSGPQTYGFRGFLELMAWRTEIVLKLLQANIEVMLFDTDIVWIRNVMPVMTKNQSIDFVGTMNNRDGSEINAGLLLLRPTAGTLEMWQSVTDAMRKFMKGITVLNKTNRWISISENEQLYLNQAFSKLKNGLCYFLVPHDVIASGRWYGNMFAPKNRRKLSPNLMAIHNNFIMGLSNKVHRAKNHGQWFLNPDLQCNRQKVLEFVSP